MNLKICMECKENIDEKKSYRVVIGGYMHEECFGRIEKAFMYS